MFILLESLKQMAELLSSCMKRVFLLPLIFSFFKVTSSVHEPNAEISIHSSNEPKIFPPAIL